MPATSYSSSGPGSVFPGAGRMLLLLLCINLFNYIDRQVLSATLPEIERELFNPRDPYLNTKLGLLTSAFLVVYMLASPLFGTLGDKKSRWLMVGGGVIAWSLASGASGLAGSFVILLLTRCLVGIGEAAYGPIAPSMISDMYPTARRGKILALFYMAIPVGSALGFVLGGAISGSYGWRTAFYAVTFPGIFLGVICFFMKEPPRYAAPPEAQGDSYFQQIRKIWRIKSFAYCTMGMTCSTFVLGGVAAFAPKYIHERTSRLQFTPESLKELETAEVNQQAIFTPEELAALATLQTAEPIPLPEIRQKMAQALPPQTFENQYKRIVEAGEVAGEMKLSKISFCFGLMVVVSGLGATLLGGFLGDYFQKYHPGAYFLVCGYSAMIAWPLFMAMVLVPFPYAWGFLFGAVFFLFLNTGPANAITANVTHSSIRATAFALNILIIHLFGDAISPTIIGTLADHIHWEVAMLVTSGFIFLAGLFWLMGARHLEADVAAVR
jgi:MFS transporter, Spinster family, sphingosine-1-phosphate transporter